MMTLMLGLSSSMMMMMMLMLGPTQIGQMEQEQSQEISQSQEQPATSAPFWKPLHMDMPLILSGLFLFQLFAYGFCHLLFSPLGLSRGIHVAACICIHIAIHESNHAWSGLQSGKSSCSEAQVLEICIEQLSLW